MRSLFFGFLLLFNSSVFAATCSDIWPSAITIPALEVPNVSGVTYSGQITADTTIAESDTETAVVQVVLNDMDIDFEGSGTRVLYIQGSIVVGGSSSINANGNVDLIIIAGGNLNITGSSTVNAVVYTGGAAFSSGSPLITGALTAPSGSNVDASHVAYDSALVAAVTDTSACETSGLTYPYTTGFEGTNSEWDLNGDFSVSNDATGERVARSGSYVLDNNSEDIDQRRRYSGHTAELNELIEIPADAVLPELSFFYKLSSIDSNDRFRVHIYRESTDSWRHVWSVNDEQNNTDYRYANIDLSGYVGERIKVRFQQRITSYANGARLFLVDDVAIQDRPIVDFAYPYTNGFEAGETDDWYLSGDLTISNLGHNNWQANSGSGFLDNNVNEISQRRHYTHHFAMMSGFVEIPNDADQPTVSFQYKIDVNDSNDRYYVEIQQSDSTSWSRLTYLRSEDDINQYAKFDYHLADSYKGTKVRVRVRQRITSYDYSARLFVMDDFRIGDKEVDDSLSYPYLNTFESASELSDWNARGDMNISTAEHDTDYVAYQGSGFIDNNPDLEDQRRHYLTHLIEMQKYVTLPNEDNVVLNFFYKLDVNDSNDRMFIEIQRAGATNWSRIETLSEQHEHASYTKYEASLAAYKGDTVRIRFRQYITSYANGPRLFVADNFYIGPQLDTYFDFPYFNDFETDISVITVNQDDSDDVNGRDQWNHEGDWDISGISDTSVDPERTSYSGDWYLNNNGAFDEDQRRHYINHEMSMVGYIQIPSDSVVPEASFFYKLDVDGDNDRFFFEYQIEGNSSWSRIQTFSLQQEHDTYTRFRYTLPDSLKGQFVRFRFRQYITSYANGPRHFTVDDFRVAERQLETFDYPYFNDFEADVSTVTVDGDDQNDTNGKDHWNHEGDWGISSAAHNAYEARSGDAFLDNNPLEEDQRRHYSGHIVEMNGALTIPSDASEPELTFYYMLDVYNDSDRMFVEIQRSDSTSWNRLRTLRFDDEHDVYTKASISLASYKGDSVRIRFRQYIASYANGPRLFTVDDFRIGDKTLEIYEFPYYNSFEDEFSDLENGINGRDQWNHEGDWYFNDTVHGDSNQAAPKSGSWYLDSNRDDEDQRRNYRNQIVEMNGYVSIPADAEGAVLSFDYHYDLIDGDLDNVYLEVQELGSTSWRRIQRFRGTEETSGYTKYEYDLDRYLGDTIRVRFRTYITSYASGPRYMSIDNFKLGYSYIGYWPLEGTLDDFSGFDNHAAAGGSDPIEYFRSNPASTLGATSTCQYIEFTGNNYMSVPDTEDHHLENEYTVSAWVYPMPDPSTGEHFSGLKSIASKDTNYEFHLDGGRVNWWWGGGDRALTSNSVVALEEWSHIAITFRNGEQNIYINGILDATTDSTSAVTTSPFPFYIGTDVATGSGSIISSRSFVGLIDEVRIYETFMEQSDIQDDMDYLRACEQPINHIRIEHPGAGVACADHRVTIKLCSNEDCSNLYDGDDVEVTLQKDESGAVSDLGAFVIEDGSGIYSNATFSDTAVAAWNFTASVTDVTDIQCINELDMSSSCAYEVSASGLIVTPDDNDTTLSCSATTFEVQAVKVAGDSSPNPDACVPAFASGNYPLTFEMNYANPNSVINSADANIEGVDHAGGIVGSNINVEFDGDAKATIDVSYIEAGEITIAVNDPTNVLSSTAATLGFYPDHLALSWESDSSVKGAGTSDNLVVVGQCANGAVTQNYEPSGQYEISVARSLPTDDAITAAGLVKADIENFEAAGQNVVVNDGFKAIDASGQADTSKLSIMYDEHTTIEIAVIDMSYLGQPIASDTSLSATYEPTYYVATNNSPELANTCSGFSYIGQELLWASGMAPQITLSGRNVLDQVTNFSDVNWLFATSDMATEMALNVYSEQNVVNNGSTVTGNTIDLTVSDETALDGARTYTITNQSVQYNKTETPDAPFNSNLNLTVPAAALMDSNKVGVKTENANAAYLDHVIEGITGTNNLYGRLLVESSFGSELENLAWVAQLQSYSADGQWLVNGSDSCTVLTENAIEIDQQNEFYFDDTTGYSLDETGAITYLSGSDTADSQKASSGYLVLDFVAPREGNIGGFEMNVDLESEASWLQWDWDADGTLDTTLPTTSVIFGRYQGNNRIIYKRER